MSRLNVVIQEKGGTFKSFTAIHLTTWLQSMGLDFHPVDLDSTPGLISKMFPDPDSSSVDPDAVNLMDGTSMWPSLFEEVLKGNNMVFDCGANTGASWLTLFNKVWIDLPAQLEKAGVKQTLIVPITNDPKTLFFFDRYKETFPNATIIAMIVKQYEGQMFETPKHPTEHTIEFPLPPSRLMSVYIDRLTPINRLASLSDKENVDGVRGYARAYLGRLYPQFEKIRSSLIP